MTSTTLPAATFALAAAFAATAAQSQAQVSHPLRPGPASAITFAVVQDVRELSDGKLFVHDGASRRIVLLDSMLAAVAVVADSSAQASVRYGRLRGRLLSMPSDTTLFIDPATTSIRVMDAAGHQVRVIAVPRPPEVGALTLAQRPGIDADKRRLVYERQVAPAGGPTGSGQMGSAGPPTGTRTLPDSAMVVAVSLSTANVDTLAFCRVAPVTASFTFDPPISNARVGPVNPAAIVDAWALLSDGTLAVVRGRDYHVDFVDAGGGRRAGPRIPFAWRPLTDDAKASLIDSLRRVEQQRLARRLELQRNMSPGEFGAAVRRARDGEPDVPGVQYEYVDPEKLPDYWPAFANGAAMADLAARLWIALAGGRGPSDGPLYDVIDRTGQRVDRIELPPGRTVVGFGREVVFAAVAVEGGVRIERLRLP